MGKTHGDTIIFNCDCCGKEKTIGLYAYNKCKNHFCSKECSDIFKRNDYDCLDEYSQCNSCNQVKHISEFMVQKRSNGTNSYLKCKVCDYLRRNRIIVIEGWTIKEYRIILDNILNHKIEYVNDIVPLLDNKTLLDISILLRDNLKIKGRAKIRFKEFCIYCGENFEIKLHQFFDDELHFCSPKCNTKYYGEIKSKNCITYKRICQYKECQKEFEVGLTRVNAGKDKYCCPECSQKSQINKIIVNCSYCNNEINVIPSRYYNQAHVFCNNECSRKYFVGENSNSWKGGLTEITFYLRNQLTVWKENTKKYCNDKCVFTGNNEYQIHHVYSFNKIMAEAFQITDIPLYEKIGQYDDEELLKLKYTIEVLHKKYSLGVCLDEKIHKLYHSIYGDDNTSEQFTEFKQRLYNNEFNKYLQYNNIILNS